tara:strand:- start:3421 stop:3996 length:576 start_codon:yes stop_codon:yes gene_type:complete
MARNFYKMKKAEQIIGLSTIELQKVAELVLKTVTEDEANELSKLRNYYTVYLKLELESDKKVYAENVKFVCKIGRINENTWSKKRSLFNQCLKMGLNVDKFGSETTLQKALKAVKGGTKKVLKNGNVKTDVANSAKIEAEKIEIQAVNDNEIISLMAMSEFKTAVKFLDANGILKATFMKAWAKHQAENNN